MIEATKWGAKAILTDKTAEFLALRQQMQSKFYDIFARFSLLTRFFLHH